jgi:hypothetical protein
MRAATRKTAVRESPPSSLKPPESPKAATRAVTDRKSISDVPRPIPYCWVTTKPPSQRSATAPLSRVSKSCRKERPGSGGKAWAGIVESTGIGQLLDGQTSQ